MKQKIWMGICALLVGILAACGVKAPGPAPSRDAPPQPQEESLSQPEEPGDEESAVPAKAPPAAMVTIYLYRPEERVYYPVDEAFREGWDAEALAEVVAVGLELPIPHLSARQMGGMVELDFPGEYVDQVMGDEETEAVLLNSLCATIQESEPTAEWFALRQDGGPYRSAHLELGLDQPYQWPPLRIGGGTAAEYAVLRQKVPYEGMDERAIASLRYDIIPLDDTGRELTRFLSRAGDPGTDIASPQEISNGYLLEQAMRNVPWYTTSDYGLGEIYRRDLRAITASVQDDTIALKEHVEQVVRELFGNLPLTHQDPSPWVWHPIEGVYTPPHIGAGYTLQPVVLEYQDLGDHYRVELVYLVEAMGAYYGDNQVIQGDLLTAAKALPHREVLVEKAEGGGLRLRSHRVMEAD